MKIKILVGASLFIFFAFVVTVVGSGLVIKSIRQNQTPSTNNNSTNINGTQNSNQTSGITLQEVAKHNTSIDCWMVISNNVYSLSSYLSSHPGGASTIISYCGQDGTVAFDSKGNSGHSSFAHSLLAQYLVGQIGQSVTTQQLNQTNQNIQQQPPANNRGGDDD